MKGIFTEFKKFALKGNALDLAVGIIIGAAFTTIVNSLVKDILMPPIGLLLNGVDFSNLYLNLSGGEYASLAEAQEAGAATINYGVFMNNVIVFLITAFAVFFLVKGINTLQSQQTKKKEEGKEEVPTCSFCFETIKKDAHRCPHCTSELKVR